MNAWGIAQRELRGYVRDRAAFLTALLLPLILVPLLDYLPLVVTISLLQAPPKGVVGVQGLPPALERFLRGTGLDLVAISHPRRSVEERKLDVALVHRPGTLVVYGRLSGFASHSLLLAHELEGLLRRYREREVARLLQRYGAKAPFQIKLEDASPPAERSAGFFGLLVPLSLLLFLQSGGSGVAIDATAGEKERKTLETLLVTPISRVQVVLGKFVATWFASLLPGLMSLVGLELGSLALGRSLPRLSYGLVAPTLLLLAALISASEIALTIWARTYKQAQTYLIPLQLLSYLPLPLIYLSGLLSIPRWWFLVPFINTTLLLSEIARGLIFPKALVLTWVSTLFASLAALAFALRSFSREETIFR